MIRPLTFACMLLAAGSGLYLYQTKQNGRILDHQIREVRDQTDATRRRAEMLHAEYELLQDPTRLAELVTAHLPDLKATQPQQWTSMAELDKRLPPVGAPVVTPTPLEASPAPATAEATPAPAPAPVVVAVTPIVRPAAVPHAAPAIVAPAIVARAVPPRQILALAREPAMRPRPAQPVVQVVATRAPRATSVSAPARAVLAAPRPVAPPATAAEAIARIARGAPVDPSVPVVASALGMARAMTVPSAVSTANASTLYGTTR